MPIYSQNIPAGFNGQSATNHAPASNFQNPPNGATYVLLVVDPDNVVVESNEGNNTAALNITQPDLLPATFA